MCNLRNFRIQSKLQQFIFHYMVYNFLQKEEKRKLNEVFTRMDTNHDGVLQKEEVVEALEQSDLFLSKKELHRLFEEMDKNEDSQISYSEFLMAAINHKQFLTEEKMEKCFNQLDQEGNGFLTKQKIKSCIFANRNID